MPLLLALLAAGQPDFRQIVDRKLSTAKCDHSDPTKCSRAADNCQCGGKYAGKPWKGPTTCCGVRVPDDHSAGQPLRVPLYRERGKSVMCVVS